MKRVAVLGGGPAGAFAAERLAQAGIDTVVFDEKLAWEKPCGGGLTYKAYPAIRSCWKDSVPKKISQRDLSRGSPRRRRQVGSRQPLVIYSRMDLNRMLLDRAEQAGAQLEKTRVLAIERGGRAGVSHPHAVRPRRISASWPPARAIRCATSARSGPPHDTMYALGYYVPSSQDHIDIQFLPQSGRLHLGVPALRPSFGGHLRQGRAGASLRARLEALHERARHLL